MGDKKREDGGETKTGVVKDGSGQNLETGGKRAGSMSGPDRESMRKRVIKKEDGRTLIYYTFTNEAR